MQQIKNDYTFSTVLDDMLKLLNDTHNITEKVTSINDYNGIELENSDILIKEVLAKNDTSLINRIIWAIYQIGFQSGVKSLNVIRDSIKLQRMLIESIDLNEIIPNMECNYVCNYSCDDIIDSMYKIIKNTHTIKQKVKFYDNYNGVEIEGDVLTIKYTMSKKHYKFCTEGNGTLNPILKNIIWFVYRLGYQSGYASCNNLIILFNKNSKYVNNKK